MQFEAYTFQQFWKNFVLHGCNNYLYAKNIVFIDSVEVRSTTKANRELLKASTSSQH